MHGPTKQYEHLISNNPVICHLKKDDLPIDQKSKGHSKRQKTLTSSSVLSSFRFKAAFTHCLASKLSSENFEKSINLSNNVHLKRTVQMYNIVYYYNIY